MINRIQIACLTFLFSAPLYADADWCRYERENRGPTWNEKIYCPSQKQDQEYYRILEEFKITINDVQKRYPKYSRSYQKIESDLFDLIEKHKSYLDAKCDFEGLSYIGEEFPTYNGTHGDAYVGLCKEKYKEKIIDILQVVIKSCNTIDEEYELPCVYFHEI